MTTTPKSVILAVVITLGLIALAVVVGAIVLQATGNGALPGEVLAIGAGAAGAVGGVLASTRTTPELPAGAVLQAGETKLFAPASAEAPGVSEARRWADLTNRVQPPSAGPHVESIDPADVPGYPLPPAPHVGVPDQS